MEQKNFSSPNQIQLFPLIFRGSDATKESYTHPEHLNKVNAIN